MALPALTPCRRMIRVTIVQAQAIDARLKLLDPTSPEAQELFALSNALHDSAAKLKRTYDA